MSDFAQTLATLSRVVTARDIVMGAAASRDWQPQHHDHDHALAMNLPGIIMNAPTQTGWLHGYALQWAGQGARIGRWRLKMNRPVCPGMTVNLGGTVTQRKPAWDGFEWVWLDLEMWTSGEVCSSMAMLLCRPNEPNRTALAIGDAEWVCPALLG
ncbi:MAG: hypothetical protein H6918_00655 [Sphingomonadaceae bacterium]|nr:hypothetical protein [Sphingomonadaceae bacterium]